LEIAQVKVTKTQIKDTLISNPNYPSMLSISESLKKWHIDAEAFKVTEDKLKALPIPFISHLKAERSFVTVKKIENDHVTYLNDQSEIKIKVNDFMNKSGGVALLIEPSSKSGQANYAIHRKHELLSLSRMPALLLVLVVISVLSFKNAYSNISYPQSISYIGWWICIVLGIVITTILMQYEYDNNNQLLKKLCSISKKTNCSAILNSKA
jgi:ABC-type bacteriocin/lantibiotic exporter with double-glycine peptidase domain